MAGYDSPIGSKKFGGTQMKSFDIPDESGYQEPLPPEVDSRVMQQVQQMQQFQQMQPPEDIAEIERQVRQARAARKMQTSKISDGAKKRLEILMGMTRTTREVDIENSKFVLQSLKGKEVREAIFQASQFDNTVEFPFEIRRQLLARSLVEIAGVSVEQFIGSNDLFDKLNFVEELDDAFLSRLYLEYTEMSKEARDKYAVVTEEDAKEVVEEIKK